jgi:lipopolysaccharide transport system permease protein
LILSAATIKNRDLNHVVPFLVNFGIWFTPVFYPVSLIPEKWSHLIYLNPMASFVQLFRCTVLPEKFQMEMLLGIPIGLVIFTIGFFYFKSIEDSIVDSI